MNINFRFLLLGTSLSLIPQYAAAQCAETDCLKLGYDKLQKCDNGLKCPFGEYWACPEPKPTLGECTGYAKNCKIGDVLNSDGTCTGDRDIDNPPLGIVVYISSGSDKCGYAMTSSPLSWGIQREIPWSREYANTGTFQSSSWSVAIKDFDVNGNMEKIIQASNGDSQKYPAAYAALDYTPRWAPETKGKWKLPTAGILGSLYTNLNIINKNIVRIGGLEITGDEEHILSSSEYSDYDVWVFNVNEGVRQGGINNCSKIITGNGDGSTAHVVRPVIAF